MRVLAAYTSQGWVQAWTLPDTPDGVPVTAAYGPYPQAPAAVETVGAKGAEVPWPEWAAGLTRRSPYGVWFAVVDVPPVAGPLVADQLAWLRAHDGLLPPD